MIKFLSKIFKKNKPKPLSLKNKLEQLKIGNLVEVKLESNFCGYAKTQPLMRFSMEELDKQKIKGVVSNVMFRSDVGCFILEILTITVDYTGATKGKSISILQDEIEDFIKYD